MKRSITPTLTIVFKKYEENVIVDETFNVQELHDIIDNDEDFVTCFIKDQEDRKWITVKKEETILGTTYNALAKTPVTHKVEVFWKLSTGGGFDKKKDAVDYAKSSNAKILQQLL